MTLATTGKKTLAIDTVRAVLKFIIKTDRSQAIRTVGSGWMQASRRFARFAGDRQATGALRASGCTSDRRDAEA